MFTDPEYESWGKYENIQTVCRKALLCKITINQKWLTIWDTITRIVSGMILNCGIILQQATSTQPQLINKQGYILFLNLISALPFKHYNNL